MAHNIFKIIWTERRSNGWILLELILAFTILWFCSDYLLHSFRLYIEPKGYNIENCYLISFGEREGGESPSREDMEAMILTAKERINRFPGVKYTTTSIDFHPYSDSWYSDILTIDTISRQVQYRKVDSDYFNVFNIELQAGEIFDSNDPSLFNRTIIVAPEADNRLYGKDINELINFRPISEEDKESPARILGVTKPIKMHEFASYTPVRYIPLSMKDIYFFRMVSFCIRVEPMADKQFSKQFSETMREQLDFGKYYLSSIKSFKEERDKYMRNKGFEEQFTTVFAMIMFLLSCIFLGMIGTFWIRVKNRTEEIGIRCAMGSSKIGIKRYFITESLILVFISSIPAAIIAFNLYYFSIIQSMNIVPSIDREGNITEISQLIGIYLLTLFITSVIVTLATWYPAKRAAKIEVAEALHYE